MAIIVKGRNAVVSPAVKAYVEKKIDKVTRQFKAVGDITAVLKVENGNHIAEITVPAKGILLRAQESTKDMYSSIDLVVEKIERQVHKYKTKLMKRKYNNFREVPADAAPVAELVSVSAEAEDTSGEDSGTISGVCDCSRGRFSSLTTASPSPAGSGAVPRTPRRRWSSPDSGSG